MTYFYDIEIKDYEKRTYPTLKLNYNSAKIEIIRENDDFSQVSPIPILALNQKTA